MKISVSLECFYYWFNEFNVKAQIKCLELIKNLDLDGVEIHFSEKELLNEDFNLFKDKLGKYFVTVHLPYFEHSKEVFEKVKKLNSLFKVNNFVIHADEWVHDKKHPIEIPFVIENSDEDKIKFQNLKDVAKLRTDVCLDIVHLEQTMPGKVKEQIDSVKGKIKEVHFSCLENHLYDAFGYIQTTHKLVYGSDYKIPGNLPRDVVWVIEGVVPKDRLDLLEKEIELLRTL